MAGLVLFSGDGGSLVLPSPGSLLIDREDGGHLCVNPPREVWERSELTAEELTRWSFLIAATGRAMIDVLPQLRGGCVNYWEAGNWALNEAALPSGPKDAPAHRSVHQHVIGRSRAAVSPAWKWGEAPQFPAYVDRVAWSTVFRPLTAEECAQIVRETRARLVRDYVAQLPDQTRPALVIFDLAGTTIRDDGQVPRAFVQALATEAIDISEAEIANVRGASKREAIRHFIPEGPAQENRADAAYESFRANLAAAYRKEGVQSLAGAPDLFKALRDRGIKVALNTGFDREITNLLLQALGWNDRTVDAIVCGDDVRNGRPAPDLIRRVMSQVGIDDPRQVANVGDTTLDLQAAHAAGVAWSIGVLSGAHDEARLTTAPHTHIAPDISYLKALFAG